MTPEEFFADIARELEDNRATAPYFKPGDDWRRAATAIHFSDLQEYNPPSPYQFERFEDYVEALKLAIPFILD